MVLPPSVTSSVTLIKEPRRLSGYVLFSLLILTSFYGGWTHWAINHSSFSTRVVAYILSPLVLLGSILFRIRPSKMKLFGAS